MYRLFLDDERDPPSDGQEWIVVRTFDAAIAYVAANGMPGFISFDHDLGEEKTGYDFAKWLVDWLEENHIPPEFDYYVHSQNPVGAANIESYLDGYYDYCYPHEEMS